MRSRERWREVSTTFERLLALEPVQRAGELARLRADDAELAREVEDLLHHDTDGFLEPPLRLWRAPVLEAGLRVGGFTLVRPLGQGGMGEVWEARQDTPARRVALKLLPDRATLGDGRERARFELEAEALARLAHPDVARVFGVGAEPLPEGGELAWIAMELCAGATDVVSWCEANAVDVPGRLALFERLCDAVRHGHARGVLHRDIKPTNVLVSGPASAPALKLIDFGVARLTDAEALDRTRTGELVGTLAYMAPEQLEPGAPQDVRTDVYALGVLLYRLLAGVHPIRRGDEDLAELVRRLATAEPTPLSVHAPALAGDLEWIAAKALEKDPAARYRTVGALLEDVRAYRAHRPTQAGPQTRLRSARKFLRRHRLACAVGGTLAGVVLTSLVAVTAALVEARDQRDVARKEVEKNAVVQDLIDSLFLGVSNTRAGRDVRVLDLLEDSATRFEPGVHSAEVELRYRTVLGGLYHALASYGRAEGELRAALARGAELGPEGEVERRLHARALLGATLLEQGRVEEGEELLTGALEEARRRGLRGTELDATRLLFKHLDRSSRFEELLAVSEAALGLAEREGHAAAQRSARAYRANALIGLGRVDEGLAATAEHHAALVAALGPEHVSTLRALSDLGVVTRLARGVEAALPLQEECAAATARVLGEDAPLSLNARNNLGGTLLAADRFDEAAAEFEQVLAAYDAMDAPPVVERLRTLNNVGMCYRNAQRFEEAEPHLRRALEEAERLLPEDDWNLAVIRLNHGGCLGRLLRLEEAEPLLLAAWDVLRHSEDALGVRHPALRTIAKVYEVNGRPEDRRFWRGVLEEDPAWQEAEAARRAAAEEPDQRP